MPALIVSVALAPVMTELDERLVLAPEGAPLTLNETACGEPLVTEVEIVDVPEPPGASVTLPGEALIEKSSAASAADGTRSAGPRSQRAIVIDCNLRGVGNDMGHAPVWRRSTLVCRCPVEGWDRGQIVIGPRELPF